MLFPEKIKFQHLRSKLLVYFLIVIVSLIIFIALGRIRPERVGDGSEYYALFLAWKETLRPWMTSVSFDAYQKLFVANQINSLVPVDWFASAFPALKLGSTADFNHFWFYSFLAFVVGKIIGVLGADHSPHTAFLSLHFILISITGSLSYYLYGKRGLATFVLMTLFSPMLWFYDKVHTELFTYCLTLMGVMLVFSNRYLLGALMFALASTQNPSFALVAFIPFVYRFLLQRTQRFTIFEVCIVVLTALAVLAHPTYYFLRFGVITPQLLAGGASLGGNLSTFYIWIIDPDLGLLPNWSVGVVIILTALLIRKFALIDHVNNSIEKPGTAFYVFLSAFFLINFYAHASTENLNSGATPGLARYALWYLPATFPICYYVMRNLNRKLWFFYPVVTLVVIAGVMSLKQYNPKKHENYTTPSALSEFIQKKTPHLYDPPAEVFAERYSGVGEYIQALHPRGVLGPDCHKLLLFSGKERKTVSVPSHCMMDQQKIQLLISQSWPEITADKYVYMSEAQSEDVKVKIEPKAYSISATGDGNFVLGSGWYQMESWGVWSKDNLATLIFPCNEKLTAEKKNLDLILSLAPYGKQSINITQDDAVLFLGTMTEPAEIEIKPNTAQCSARAIVLKINIPQPLSPASLGASNDARNLGVGLRGFTIKP